MRDLTSEEQILSAGIQKTVSYCPADYGALLRPEWAAARGCVVVPTESAARLPGGQIPLISTALAKRGYDQCYVVLSEDLGLEERPVALGTSASEFEALNSRYGIYRFVIVPADAAWAIACNEWFNLFGAPQGLVAEMLGCEPELARREFDLYAAKIGGSLTYVADLYRSQAA